MRRRLFTFLAGLALAACQEPPTDQPASAPAHPAPLGATTPAPQMPSVVDRPSAGVADRPQRVEPGTSASTGSSSTSGGSSGSTSAWGPTGGGRTDPANGMAVRVDGPVIERPGDGDLPAGTSTMPGTRTDPSRATTPGSWGSSVPSGSTAPTGTGSPAAAPGVTQPVGAPMTPQF